MPASDHPVSGSVGGAVERAHASAVTTLEHTRGAGARSGLVARLSSARMACAVALGLGAGAWATWTWLLVAEWANFHDYHRDLAIQLQVMRGLARGHPFETTLLTRNVSHLAEHVALLLLPLAPLHALVPDPRWLIALQQAALVLAGLPIFLLARRRLGGAWAALAVLASFLLAPPLFEVAWDYWHPVAFTALPIAFGAYFLFTGRPRLGVPVAALSLLVHEEAALALLGLGATLLLRRQRRAGLALGGIALAWLALVVLVVLPAFALDETVPEEGNRSIHKFSDLLQDPTLAARLLAERGPDALRWLVLPSAGLPLLAPRTLVASLPTALVITFSDDPTYLRSHHDAPMLPLLWIAAVDGLAALRAGWPRRTGLGALLAATLLTFALDSRMPAGGNNYVVQLTRWDNLSAAMARAVAAVPPDATLAATTNAVVHLVDRDQVKIYPFKYARVLKPRPREMDWWVIDVTTSRTRGFETDRDSPLRADPPYALWLVDDTVLVATDHPPLPARPYEARFGDTLRLERYDARLTPDGIDVRLAWTLARPLAGEASDHLEVLAAGGAVLAEHHGPASASYFPPSKWKPGQVVVEDVALPLDPRQGAAARVRVTWRGADGETPLALADGSPSLTLDLTP